MTADVDAQSARISCGSIILPSRTLRSTLTLVTLAFLVSCSTPTDETGPHDPFQEIVWRDEFDGLSVDTSRWQFQVGDNWYNNELQAYTSSPSNVFVSNGLLVIRANKEILRAKNYTSARLRTKDKGDWKFGKIEVRARLPKGKGIWPAIWMLSTDEKSGSWPKSGEIDIVELVGHVPQTVHGTVHYGTDGTTGHRSQGNSYTMNQGNFSDDFHTFVILWDQDSIKWFVDGTQFFSINSSSFAPFPYPFNERFHLILNVAVGGDWPGNPDSTTVFPQSMEIDYVRVYAR